VLRDIPQDEALLTPVTPVTPMTTEGLSSLHNLIKQDTCASERLQRCVQKLASAAQISFAKQHLLQDHNRLLAKINNEAKVRRSTKSVVLGKAKVMSFEDLEEARVKRAVKDKATADKGKGKRGRKRKNPVLEVGVLEPEPEVIGEAAEPWRAPVARMY
jgi:hypothetical protein